MTDGFGRLATVTLLLAAVGGGCDKKIVVTYYPPFYDEQLQSVAVLPFSSARRGGGEAVADALIDALAADGTYTVVSGPGLLKKLRDAGYGAGSGPADGRHYGSGSSGDLDRRHLLAAAGTVGGIDAVLVGQVPRFEAGAMLVREVDYYDGGYSGRYGGGYYPRHYSGGYYGRYGPPGYSTVRHSRINRGTVGAAVTLLRVADGKTLAAPAEAVTVTSSGGGRELTPEQCLTAATRELAARFARELTPSPREVSLDPGKTVKTARARGAKRYQFTEESRGDDSGVWIVVRLPAACARNTFELRVTHRDDKGTTLWRKRFTPQPGQGQLQFEVPLADLAPADKGSEYAVRFLYDGREVFDRKFKVKR